MDRRSLKSTLVKDWQEPIYNFALRWFGNESDAADATQETFLKAFGSLHQLRQPEKLGSWIFAIARREMIRLSKSRPTASLDPRSVPESESAAMGAQSKEREGLIRDELARLPAELKSVLILRFYQDLSLREISDHLAKPSSTIHSQIQRALEKLRGRLTTCGAGFAVFELEQLLTGPSVSVPQALQTKLAALAAPSGLAGTTIAIGGAVKLKLITVGAVALTFGVSTWLVFGPDSPLEETDSPPPIVRKTALDLDPRIELTRVRKQKEALEKELKQLRSAGSQEGPVLARLTRENAQLRESMDKLQRAHRILQRRSSEKGPLSAEAQAKKAKERKDFIRSFAKSYTDAQAEMEAVRDSLTAQEFEARDKQLRTRFLPGLVRLYSDPQGAAEGVMALILETGPKKSYQLAKLLEELTYFGQMEKGNQDNLNRQLLPLIQDSSWPHESRVRFIKSLQVSDENETRSKAVTVLTGVLSKAEDTTRAEVAEVLAKKLFKESQAELKALLLSEDEPIQVRWRAIEASDFRQWPEGESLLQSLTKSPQSSMRSKAYAKLAELNSSDRVKNILEQSLDKEREDHAQRVLLESLVKVGDHKSANLIQRFIDEGRFSKSMNDRAQLSHQKLLQRLGRGPN